MALTTILCHYSSLVYHYFLDNSAMLFLKHNPNLLLPIYPCNVVMWCCLIFAFTKKESRFSKLLADYIFWFGIISTLVGMFANVDFINNPTFANYDITKSIVAHATMLLNVLVLPAFGFIKIKLETNLLHMVIAIAAMFVIGMYCNLVFEVLVSSNMAYQVNSMFILHSPFEGLAFLTYPNIAIMALAMYFIIFGICEMFAYKKGTRWYNRFVNKIKTKHSSK